MIQILWEIQYGKPDDRLCFIYSIKNTFDKENRERIEDYWLKYDEKAIKFIKNNKYNINDFIYKDDIINLSKHLDNDIIEKITQYLHHL